MTKKEFDKKTEFKYLNLRKHDEDGWALSDEHFHFMATIELAHQLRRIADILTGDKEKEMKNGKR